LHWEVAIGSIYDWVTDEARGDRYPFGELVETPGKRRS